MNHTETNTAMEIMLSDFHYYFTMTGEQGGLYSLSMEFEPSGVVASSDEMKEVVRYAIATHTDLLDRILSEVVEGEKKPTMTDTSHQTSIGYHYCGNLTRKGVRNLGDHLQSLFGERVESLGVAISNDASTAMRQLQKTLQNIETANAQGDIDHYKRIIES